MLPPHAYYLLIDFEATCSDDGAVPKEEMEIIEIGAAMQRTGTFEVAAEFQSFVRPVRHPRLTPFCTELTTITQDQVDAAPLFPEVLAALVAWAAPYDDCLFCSWGDYDRNQLQQDCAFHGVAYPFGDEHLNLKAAFSQALGTKRRFGMAGALRKLGLKLEGTHHRGIDDIRNIARVVRSVFRPR